MEPPSLHSHVDGGFWHGMNRQRVPPSLLTALRAEYLAARLLTGESRGFRA